MKDTIKLLCAMITIILVLAMAFSLLACGKTPSPDDDPPSVEATTHTVTFDSDGGTAVASSEVLSGVSVSAPAAPTRDGYAFVAWTLNGVDYDFTSPVTRDITLKARWTEVKTTFSVIFTGADGATIDTVEVSPNGTATAPEAPVRPGYEFIGWDKPLDNITSDTTVTALYIPVWEVRFVNFDGTVLKTETIRDGASATAPTETPTRENHVFIGWDTAFDNITATTTVTAQFAENAKHTVTFANWDGTVLKTETVYTGGAATAPTETPTRENHEFIGWDKKFDSVTEAITVIALFRENGRLSVQFVDHDGTVLKSENVYAGGAATAPADPTREHYDFVGWDKAFDNVTDNLVVNAIYREHSKFTVTFKDYDGAEIDSVSCYTGETVAEPNEPTREGYIFSAWHLNETEYNFSSPVTDNITLVAVYTQAAYTATYIDENGNTLGTVSVAAGETPTPPATPYKAHHVFDKWVVASGSIESGNITYRASYALVRHVVTFNHANGTGTTTPVTADDCTTVTPPNAPAYSGFTFLCWVTDAGEHFDFSTHITRDITLTAKYERVADIPAATTGNIVINPGYLEFWMDLTLQLNIQANVTYTSGTKVEARSTDVHYDGFTYTFYTDNPAVISIEADGTITPLSMGEARVWAVVHTGGTQTYSSANDYTQYDTFTVADGTVLSPIEVKIIDKPDYLKLYESDPEKQKIRIGSDAAIVIDDYLSKPAGEYGSANIALWYNDATAVMTITVDDNIVGDFDQWELWNETYGIPISIMAITRDYQLYVNRWSDMTALGNEVQPHGHNHHSSAFYSSGYITSAQEWVDSYNSKKVIESANGERVLVFSYPCGHNASFNKLLYIGGRGVSYLPVKAENTNYNSVDLQSIPSAEQLAALFDPSLSASHFKYGGWFNALQHNIGTDKSKYDELFPEAKKYMDDGRLWAALFSAACQYGQERDSATLTMTGVGADTLTFTLTDKMNDMLFDHALTVKIKVDNTWSHARAYQNGNECETRIVTENDETYVYVNAVPDKGEVKVIRSAVTNLTETATRITFTPTGAVGVAGEDAMTMAFTVDATTWKNAYAVQNGKVLPTTVTTHAGVTTMTVTCYANAGEVTIVPLSDQYNDRKSFTMQEVWSGLVTPDGTRPVFISTAEDMVMFSDYVRNHGVTDGITFRLTDDIDMAGVENFLPIGWQTDPKSNGDLSAMSAFSGTFDGATHTICNLTIEQPDRTYVGLFGYAKNATITRLTVIGSVRGLDRVGGIVGRMSGGTMNGVIFEGSVTAIGDPHYARTGSRVGGIAGQIDSIAMKNCAAYASVNAYTVGKSGFTASPKPNGEIDSGILIGGIVGEVYYAHQTTSTSTFDNIVFDGTVIAHKAPDGTGADYVGGFAGRMGQSNVTNVTVNADVIGSKRVGGFAGHLTHLNFISATYTNCAVNGTVTGDDYVAGFAGMIDANNTQKLYNCISTVRVNAPETAANVGALYGACPYGTQNTTSNNIFYIEELNPGMAPHPGTVKEPTKYCIAATLENALTALNTYATTKGLPAWRLIDGNPSASYFPVFTVTILDKGGNVVEEQAVGNTLSVVLPEAPFITGFEFDHWSGNTTNITSDGTIQMIYREVETYTVTFLDKDGGVIDMQTINIGRGATAPAPVVYERFLFTGWDTAFDNITADTTVNAVYTDAYYVTFSYKAADGTQTTTVVKTAVGSGAEAPTVPAVDGFMFNGWDTAFDNVTSDITVTAQYTSVTAGPVSLKVLQWSLTSAPSDAFFATLSGAEVILYAGATDISKVTLPENWAAQGIKNDGQDASLSYSAVIYHTAKYKFDDAAGIYGVSMSSAATNAYCLAVPLIDLATNQQIVASIVTLGYWASANSFGDWGKTEKALKICLPGITENYSSASGILIGLRAQTKDTNTGILSQYSTCDDKKAYVTGYDLIGLHEVDSDTKADYVLTFIKDGKTASIENAETVPAADGISTNNGIRYTITFSDAEGET